MGAAFAVLGGIIAAYMLFLGVKSYIDKYHAKPTPEGTDDHG